MYAKRQLLFSKREVQVQAAQERKNVAALKISSDPRSIPISLGESRYTHSSYIQKLLNTKRIGV